jgi:hypothetical protein
MCEIIRGGESGTPLKLWTAIHRRTMMKGSRLYPGYAILLATALIIGLLVREGSPSTGETGPARAGTPLYSLKLSGGATHLPNGIGDIKILKDQVEGLYTSLLNGVLAPAYETNFNWPQPTYIPDFGLDLMVHLNSRVAVALGTGYFWDSSTGNYSFSYSHARPNGSLDQNTASYLQKFKVSVVPVTLNLYFFQPVGGFRVFTYGGFGYYFGRLTHDYSVTATLMNTSGPLANPSAQTIFDETLNVSEKAHQGAFGVQGGAGIEVNLTGGLSLGAEFYDRFLNFRSWSGDSTSSDQTRDRRYTSRQGWYRDVQQTSQRQDKGGMWYGFDLDPWLDLYSDVFYVGDNRQPINASEFRRRNASINLSAVGLLISIRYNFDLPW